MNATRELRKGNFPAVKKKLMGWGGRILEERAGMRRKVGVKWTQGDLGKAVGVSAQQISRYEAETDEPSYETWVAMARALMTTPGELMFGLPIEEGIDEALGASRTPRKRKGARG